MFIGLGLAAAMHRLGSCRPSREFIICTESPNALLHTLYLTGASCPPSIITTHGTTAPILVNFITDFSPLNSNPQLCGHSHVQTTHIYFLPNPLSQKVAGHNRDTGLHFCKCHEHGAVYTIVRAAGVISSSSVVGEPCVRPTSP